MRRLNNKGYMLVEIIVASVIAFSVAYYLLNLTYKFKDKSEDIYYSTTMLSDKINITKNIMNDLEKISDKSSDGLVKGTDNNTYTITIKGKDDKNSGIISRTIKVSKDATTQQWQIEYGSFQTGAFVTNDKSYYKKALDKSFEVSNVSCESIQNDAYAYKIIIKINSLYTNDSNDIILFVNRDKSPSNTQNEDFSSEIVTIKIDGIDKPISASRNVPFLVEQPETKPKGKENFVLLGYSLNEKATNPEYKVEDSIDIKEFNKETTLYPIWIIDPEKTFNIASTTVNTNYKKWVLDVDHGTNKNGTLVTLYGKHYGENQKWKFEYDKGSGNYRIHSGVDFDNMCLDVNGAKFVNGTQVQIWGCNTSAAQEFKLVTNRDGSYGFSVAADTMYLDVKGGKFSSGTQIQVYQKNGTNAQKWELLPIISN